MKISLESLIGAVGLIGLFLIGMSIEQPVIPGLSPEAVFALRLVAVLSGALALQAAMALNLLNLLVALIAVAVNLICFPTMLAVIFAHWLGGIVLGALCIVLSKSMAQHKSHNARVVRAGKINRIRWSISETVGRYHITRPLTNNNVECEAVKPELMNLARPYSDDWNATLESVKVINRLFCIAGITKLHFYPYELQVTLAQAFDWSEVQDEILQILKEEYFGGAESVLSEQVQPAKGELLVGGGCTG